MKSLRNALYSSRRIGVPPGGRILRNLSTQSIISFWEVEKLYIWDTSTNGGDRTKLKVEAIRLNGCSKMDVSLAKSIATDAVLTELFCQA